jgi:hypothetical protein
VLRDAFCGECRGALDEPPATAEHPAPAPTPRPKAEVRRHASLEVRAHSRAQILRNFAGYLPLILFAGVFYFVFGAAGLVYLLKHSLGEDQAGVVGASAAAAIVLLSGVFYVRFVVNRLARCGLSLVNDVVVVRGQTSGGFVEKRYAVGDLEAVAFGERLNAAERVLEDLNRLGVPKTGTIRLVKDLKAGRLLLTDKYGGHEVFHFVDKVFDLDSLSAFVAELGYRGVMVAGPP